MTPSQGCWSPPFRSEDVFSHCVVPNGKGQLNLFEMENIIHTTPHVWREERGTEGVRGRGRGKEKEKLKLYTSRWSEFHIPLSTLIIHSSWNLSSNQTTVFRLAFAGGERAGAPPRGDPVNSFLPRSRGVWAVGQQGSAIWEWQPAFASGAPSTSAACSSWQGAGFGKAPQSP